jgi:hypothetical protein
MRIIASNNKLAIDPATRVNSIKYSSL